MGEWKSGGLNISDGLFLGGWDPAAVELWLR